MLIRSLRLRKFLTKDQLSFDSRDDKTFAGSGNVWSEFTILSDNHYDYINFLKKNNLKNFWFSKTYRSNNSQETGADT
jgi:hypothetical protein